MKVIGFDPGKLGGWCILGDNGEILKKGVTPLIGKDYDTNALGKLIEECDYVCVENPSVIEGASKSAVASLHKNVGFLHGVAVGCKKPYFLITPKEWQKVMWENIPRQYKATSSSTSKKQVDTKATSTIAALRFFPEEDFKITAKGNSGSKNYHDGIVDAALIARYFFEK